MYNIKIKKGCFGHSVKKRLESSAAHNGRLDKTNLQKTTDTANNITEKHLRHADKTMRNY